MALRLGSKNTFHTESVKTRHHFTPITTSNNMEGADAVEMNDTVPSILFTKLNIFFFSFLLFFPCQKPQPFFSLSFFSELGAKA